MLIQLDIMVSDLFNGNILPRDKEDGLVLCDLVVRQGSHDMVKLPISRGISLRTIYLYDTKTEIPSEMVFKSSMGVVTRLVDDTTKIEIYAYKLYNHDMKHMGYTRRIGPHSEQDIPIDVIDPANPSKNHKLRQIVVKHVPGNAKPYKPQKKVRTLGIGSAVWLTQKPFYGSCHVTSCNALQFIDYKELFLDFLHGASHATDQSKYNSPTNVLIAFGKQLEQQVKYRSDYTFNKPKVVDDFGDASLEISYYGDCEDMAHYYMRNIRMLMKSFQYGLTDKSSSIYKACEKLAEDYIPYVYICRIIVNGRKEYHSTMLLLPTAKSGEKPISFEVTSPRKTLDLGNYEDLEDFKKWHINSYFLLDNEFIMRLEDRKDIETLTIEEFKDKCMNY